MDRILLGHGAGGRRMLQLIQEYIAPVFALKELGDSAVLKLPDFGRLAFTTDSFVVSPLFFPGGDIGTLSVHGTVNDLAVAGAKPLYLTVGLIIEEGFLFEDFRKILQSIADAAAFSKVQIVAGDTKVVERGMADGLYVNTSGVGIIDSEVNLGAEFISPGDKIILSGPVGFHGIAILAQRSGITFEVPLLSDTAPLNHLVYDMMSLKGAVHAMRDPTRGGLATTLAEFAMDTGLCLEVYEDKIPIPDPVKGACELLGYDPYLLANEGVLVAFVSQEMAEALLNTMKKNQVAYHASIIGHVSTLAKGKVILHTQTGGKRILDMVQDEHLPRIC